MKFSTLNCRNHLALHVLGCVFAILLPNQVSAASCPCELSTIPHSAWTTDVSSKNFDKVDIDTGILCTRTIYKGSTFEPTSPGRFQIFKRFVGIKGDKKSQHLAEIRIAHVAKGKSCVAQIEKAGQFDESENVLHAADDFSQEEYVACMTEAQAYAKQLNIDCEKVER